MCFFKHQISILEWFLKAYISLETVIMSAEKLFFNFANSNILVYDKMFYSTKWI